MSKNMATASPTGWSVEIVKLPLPAAPISEGGGNRATVLSPPRSFTMIEDALAHARELVQTGYGLQMMGPAGQVWDHRQILAYLNKGA